MLHGLGVDLLKISRIAGLGERRLERLGRRFLSPRELQLCIECRDEQDRKRFFATRWAAKEAAYKASTPYEPSFRDLELTHTSEGAPALSLLDEKIPLSFKASISHDGEYVVASVVALERLKPSHPQDKRGNGEMVEEYERDLPRNRDSAGDWIDKW